MNTLTLPAPGKLNLFLHIIGQREDGYHLLQSAMQFITYGDQLSFEVIEKPVIDISGMPTLNKQDNLIYRAAQYLQNTAAKPQGIKIHVEKNLPMGAGLGGGSSNAATTLLALNHLWQLNHPLETLAQIGLELGADIPFFVNGHSAWVEGIGEKITPCDFPDSWYLLLIPPVETNTGHIFSSPELTRDTPQLDLSQASPIKGHNDCERVVRNLYPEVAHALDWLSQFAKAQLTGTGSCVFAPFENEANARAVLKQCPKHYTGLVTKACNLSPLHEQLRSLKD